MQQMGLFNQNVPHTPKKSKPYKIIGQRFGRLVVLRFAYRNKNRKAFYECQCDCGQTAVIALSNLRTGNSKSCGCSLQEQRAENGRQNKIGIIGQKFGLLTVESEVGQDSKGEYRYKCRCECGGEKVLRGRFLRNGMAKSHCGCLDPAPKKKKVKRKPIDREQMAKDLYCWLLDGWSIRDIARENGWASGGCITVLFNSFIPGYKEKSQERRSKSSYRKAEKKTGKLSKIFRYEKNFQKHCSEILCEKNIPVEENNRELTGFEIDLLTPEYAMELKISGRKRDLYRAVGQSVTNASILKLKPAILIPSDVVVDSDMIEVIRENNIYLLNERDL